MCTYMWVCPEGTVLHVCYMYLHVHVCMLHVQTCTYIQCHSKCECATVGMPAIHSKEEEVDGYH